MPTVHTLQLRVAILLLLLREKASCRAIHRLLRDRSDGLLEFKLVSVSATLTSLEREALITPHREVCPEGEDGRRRFVYYLTPGGRHEAEKLRSSLGALIGATLLPLPEYP